MTTFSVIGDLVPVSLSYSVSDTAIVTLVQFDETGNAVGARTATVVTGTAIGTTTVTITATDAENTQQSTSFIITVNDALSFVDTFYNQSMNTSSVRNVPFTTQGGTGTVTITATSSDANAISATVIGSSISLLSSGVSNSAVITLDAVDSVNSTTTVTFTVSTIDPCDSTPCYFGASCAAGLEGAFTCTCTSGYEGELCNQDINGCAGVSCFAGVSCIDAVAPQTGYRCGMCPQDYVGNGSYCVTKATTNFESTVISSSITLSIDSATIADLESFKAQIQNDICAFLSLKNVEYNCSRIYVNSVEPGSVVIELYLLPDTNQIAAANALLNGMSNNDPLLKQSSFSSYIVYQSSGIVTLEIPNNSTSMIVTGVSPVVNANTTVKELYISSSVLIGYGVSGGTGNVVVTAVSSNTTLVPSLNVDSSVISLTTGAVSGVVVINVTAIDDQNIATLVQFIVIIYGNFIFFF